MTRISFANTNIGNGRSVLLLNAALSSDGALNYVWKIDQWLDEKFTLAYEEDADKIRRRNVKEIQDYAKDEAVVYYIGFVNLHANEQFYSSFELSPSDIYQVTNKLVKD